MKIEYIIFLLFLVGWIRVGYKCVISKYSDKDRLIESKQSRLSQSKTVLTGGAVTLISSASYAGAYYYADLKYFWMVLAVLYFIVGLFTLLMGIVVATRFKGSLKEVEHQHTAKEKYKNVNFWPKWKVASLYAYQFILLLLWLYSWRYLFN